MSKSIVSQGLEINGVMAVDASYSERERDVPRLVVVCKGRGTRRQLCHKAPLIPGLVVHGETRVGQLTYVSVQCPTGQINTVRGLSFVVGVQVTAGHVCGVGTPEPHGAKRPTRSKPGKGSVALDSASWNRRCQEADRGTVGQPYWETPELPQVDSFIRPQA
jgi:hypothetical protein